ncbi:COG4315 family predicted lipoprotein [Uliginosibacterium sp. H1]|uniref:COG4315 family predicted lipoprotein n=1 Tax=Uliginosibacterium sp. H1 TaxID=3114757 RepID=UPI002E176A58|nr:hypothetical protein [Uliginosibacterium sp. H1]
MNNSKLHLALACAVLALSACSTMSGPAAPAATRDGVLANDKGMTLYTYDKDAGGKSVCNGQCAINWPPLMAKADDKATGDWTVITRDDGSKQWAYKGKPLYLWIKDTKPGDKSGDNVGNVWRLAKP